MPKMQDHDLKALLAEKIRRAHDAGGGRLGHERAQAERYYRGEKFGNEIEGRSQVVSRDVAETVDSMMPSLMKVFSSGDEVVRFEPRGPEDEASAAQATDYVNWIWNHDNDGFAVFHDWFKDALLKRLGIVKIWWDDAEEQTRERYEGLSDAEYRLLCDDEAVAVVEHTEYPDPLLSLVMAAPSSSSGAAGAGTPERRRPRTGWRRRRSPSHSCTTSPYGDVARSGACAWRRCRPRSFCSTALPCPSTSATSLRTG